MSEPSRSLVGLVGLGGQRGLLTFNRSNSVKIGLLGLVLGLLGLVLRLVGLVFRKFEL